EAFHFDLGKPRSREFFERMAFRPEQLGTRVAETLSREHGTDYWRRLLELGGLAWLEINRRAQSPADDLFDGRLGALRVPTLILHGAKDPRTEPDELGRVQRQLPDAKIHLVEEGAHSPHSESASAAESNRAVREFLLAQFLLARA